MTVLTPVEAVSYASVVNLREFLGIPATTLGDSYLIEALRRGKGEIDKITNRRWDQYTIQDLYVDATGHSRIILRYFPIISITKLEIRKSDGFSELTIYDPATNTGSWRIYDADAGIIEFIDNAPSKGIQSIRINYVAGYEAPPPVIVSLNVLISAFYSLQSLAGVKNPVHYSSISEGDLSISFGEYRQRITQIAEEIKGIVDSIGKDYVSAIQ